MLPAGDAASFQLGEWVATLPDGYSLSRERSAFRLHELAADTWAGAPHRT